MSEGKILRKPFSIGATSSSLIVNGAPDTKRQKLLRVRSEGKLSSRESVDTDSRSLRRFVVLTWIIRYFKFLQLVEKEMREATVVSHELARHAIPNLASCKRGSAAAISATSTSVKLNVQIAVAVGLGEQVGVKLRKISSRNSIMGVMKTASMGTLG